MMADFHFLRPFWLLALLPLSYLFWRVWQQRSFSQAWSAVCDPHLLKHLLRGHGESRRHLAVLCLFLSGLFAIIALSGPAWVRLPVPTWNVQQPTVVLLDLSDSMLVNDVSPNRLTRARFVLHDLFTGAHAGQFGLVVYTGQPFVVSPLTEDGKTIDALLQALSPDIMPVGGQDLSSALEQGADLIHQAGFQQGKLLVLSATPPDSRANNVAKKLAAKSIDTSVMPIMADQAAAPMFQPLAKAGHGTLLTYPDTNNELARWMQSNSHRQEFTRSEQNDVAVWRDDGRWFLIPALVFLLPVFRRGWLLRVAS
ncbi:vWA domain-containing protein [Legionella sp. CNM-4043-24]|uniref:vWA domain-containing protein n=1 Tax=Legionella sp. CNM-4043-24 TaxID=3421646 RepID=UPI00403ACD9D